MLGTTTSGLGERRQTAAFAGRFDSVGEDAGAMDGGLPPRRGRAEASSLLSTALHVVRWGRALPFPSGSIGM